MTFKNRLRARGAREQKLKKHRDFLLHSIRMHLLPAFIQQRFTPDPAPVEGAPVDRKYKGTFPFELRRVRPDGGVDLVEIQFKTYHRAAFRINVCAVPKEGMITLGGHRTVEDLHASGLHDHFETHARPWLRPLLRALGLEPLGEWFSLWLWYLRYPKQADYDRLVLRVAGVLPELELALREGKLGPHVRRIV